MGKCTPMLTVCGLARLYICSVLTTFLCKFVWLGVYPSFRFYLDKENALGHGVKYELLTYYPRVKSACKHTLYASV